MQSGRAKILAHGSAEPKLNTRFTGAPDSSSFSACDKEAGLGCCLSLRVESLLATLIKFLFASLVGSYSHFELWVRLIDLPCGYWSLPPYPTGYQPALKLHGSHVLHKIYEYSSCLTLLIAKGTITSALH